jgi:hypothetical protein
MKRTIITIAVIFLNFMVQAQWIQSADLRIGLRGISTTLSKNVFFHSSILFETGLGMQGVNNKLNDPWIGGGLKYTLKENDKNQFSISASTGWFWVYSDIFKTSSIYFKPTLDYTRFFGKEKKQGALVSLGYNFGKGYYRQKSSDEYFDVEYVSNYRLKPLVLQIGYCYRFK